MSALLRRALLVALVLALGRDAAAAEVAGFHYTREITVPSPGWVGVPLDLAALQHLAPGGSDLHVFAPGGGEVALRVEAAATLSVTSRDAECEAGRPGATFCTLTLPAAGQIVRRLSVEIAGAGDVGHRLDVPRAGRWQTLAAGVWRRSGERTGHLIAGGPEPVPGSVLRLALYGSPQAPPRLASWGVELTVQTVLFEATEAGPYMLAYGGAPRAGVLRAEAPPAAEVIWLEAGGEVEHAPPSLPIAAPAPATRLGTRPLAGAWEVIAPAAKPGILVRLELPDAVYGAARADLGNLRLVKGERQIPFYRWSPADPVLAARRRELRPARRGRRSRESEVEIRLPEPGLPVTELDLWAPAGLLRRAVGIRYLEPARPPRKNGGRHERHAVARDIWECRPQPPVPCHKRLPLPGPAPRSLSVRFYDGDNPPLEEVEAEVWRRRDVLLFVWPETEEDAPLRLLAGPENLRAPSYDLGVLGETLLSYPWQPAELSLGETAAASEPWWSRWVRPLTLAVAAICLLLLLRRILAEA